MPKLYAVGSGGFADMFREKIGQRYDFRRYLPHEFMRADKASDARKLYNGEWRPGDCLFEVRAPEAGRPGYHSRAGIERASAFVIVREVPTAQVFGRSAPRSERFIQALDRGTLDQAERFLNAWRALPDGWVHCTCDDGDECPHEAEPGSRAALADYGDLSYERDPESESLSLFAKYAEPVAKDYAAAIWWYQAGRVGLDAGSYSAGWRTRADPRLPDMGSAAVWIEEVVKAYRAVIGSGLLWHELAAADRGAWASVTAAYAAPEQE
jgi:hypothetical protein